MAEGMTREELITKLYEVRNTIAVTATQLIDEVLAEFDRLTEQEEEKLMCPKCGGEGHISGNFEQPIGDDKLDNILTIVKNEYLFASNKFPPFYSPHEGLAIIQEEFEELKAEVFKSRKHQSLCAMEQEAIQVAAMAVRFIFDVTAVSLHHPPHIVNRPIPDYGGRTP